MRTIRVLLLLVVMGNLTKADELEKPLVLLDICPCRCYDQRLASHQYEPQAGDMLLFETGRGAQAFFRAFTGRSISHVAVMVEVDDQLLVLSAEKRNGVVLEELHTFLRRCNRRDVVWVRRMRQPLSCEQKRRLADWVIRQVGKPYAYLNQVIATPYRVPVVRQVWGLLLCDGPEQPRWFCSQLVCTAYQVCGLIDGRYRAKSMDPGELCVMPGPWTRPFCLVGLTSALDH
ncbi:MAG: YiiX/YebB-like N1pC/P60 family cysteine hydrolase [Patescibacteria group bacterium]